LSLTIREEHRLRVFGNMRRIFGAENDELTSGRGNCIMRSFTKYKKNDQVKEDEIGRVCSTHGGEEKCM
jgi:hypothetical protein